MTDAALSFRRARSDDVPAIVHLLADDPLGATRERDESPLPPAYLQAFRAVDGDANNELVVVCQGEQVVGVLQLTFIPYLTYQGGWRALIEGVRVASGVRSQGVGKALIEWAIGRAREREVIEFRSHGTFAASEEQGDEGLLEIVVSALAFDQRARPELQFVPVNFVAAQSAKTHVDTRCDRRARELLHQFERVAVGRFGIDAVQRMRRRVDPVQDELGFPKEKQVGVHHKFPTG